jgi:phenylacetate-CoA ligase
MLTNLERSQYAPIELIRERQLASVKAIVKYASEHTSFYRRRLADQGMNAEDIRSLEDLKNFPVLTKDDIRANLDDMISEEFTKENLRHKRTGGSTSVPLQIYVDPTAYAYKYAATRRHNRWAGYGAGDKLASIWGATDRKYSTKEKLVNYFVTRSIYLDTLKLDEPYMLSFIDQLRKYRPRTLIGHAHSLYIFARFVDEHGAKDLPFDSIISTSEILYDNERAFIEKVFGRILFDRYGCEELSIVASECDQHDGLHINAEGLYIEVAGGDETSPGNLVITDLWNRGMPLIRYEVGDRATAKPGVCRCGRGLPRLGRIYGRTSDFLYTPEGKMLSGISILDTFTIHIPGFKQVQIIQDRIDELRFLIVKGEGFGDNSTQLLAEKIPVFFGPSMKYTVDFVDAIPQTRRGKYRFTICNIEAPGNKGAGG